MKTTDDIRYVVTANGQIVLEQCGGQWQLPHRRPGGEVSAEYRLSETPLAVALVMSDPELHEGLQWHDLRKSHAYLPAGEYNIAVKGAELAYWDARTSWCSICGAPMQRATEISKKCTSCGDEVFPSLATAILVLVTRDDEALLVRAKTFKRPFFGLVAGFVETGESLEQCVAREVKEETSLEIRNIRYFGSQSWPFPFNLMIGFTAEYASGEVTYADGELCAGRFFSRNDLPELATPPSLARTMIDAWINGDIAPKQQ